MIQIAKQSLNDKKSRPERIKKRKQKVEEWVTKIKKGDDPCDVYADIQKSGNTF
ncbi:hypothetical protein [Algibacillus agarilyticus]|uniref:hypothetical protein n=1 Tax=Algibacillus agarilyticus TaxID=2234133 RepID=UPI0013007965|nr:hypothetical protein [Algibacillus agarilyticus]